MLNRCGLSAESALYRCYHGVVVVLTGCHSGAFKAHSGTALVWEKCGVDTGSVLAWCWYLSGVCVALNGCEFGTGAMLSRHC